MFDRIKRAIANWQDLAIWLPLMLGLLLATTYLLPRADPMAAVDGLGFLQGYAALLVKGVLITFAAWMCKRTYTQDLTDDEERALRSITLDSQGRNSGAFYFLLVDRLEWLMWLVLWYVILSG